VAGVALETDGPNKRECEMPEANLFLDKRAHTRVPVKIPVTFKIIGDHGEVKNIKELGEKLKVAQTVDSSLGGIYLVADQPFKIGDILNLKITIPNLPIPLAAYADVVWANETGAGLQFLAIKDSDLESFAAYLKRVSDRK
jgi:hypothetical protein